MNIVFSTANTIRGPRPQDDFSYSITETPAVSSPTTASITINDINVNRITGTLTGNNFMIVVADSLLTAGHSFINQTPSIVSVDGLGSVSRLANGAASVDIQTPVGARNYTRIMTNTGASTQDIFQSFVAGTLGKHITDAMLALVSGKTASDATKEFYSSNNYDAVSPIVVRNTSCFSASVNLSCISVMNWDSVPVRQNYVHQGLLISPRHIIGATHFPTENPIVFMRPDGTFQTVNVVSEQNQVGGSTDIRVAYLSAAVTGITPFQVLPANWATYLPTLTSGTRVKLPVLTKTAHNAAGAWADQISINQLQSITSNSVVLGPQNNVVGLPVLATDAWYSPVTGGDSGSAVFVPINNNPVLLCSHLYTSSGRHYGNYISSINSAMNALATAAGDATVYALTAPTLTGFTAF